MTIIIGAGISGLALAWYLQKAGKPYILLEAAESPGGYIRTKREKGYTLELGPNSLICDENTLNFLEQTGLSDEIIPANEVSKSRFIYKKGQYQKLPDNPISLLTSSFFSFQSKISILTELFKKSALNPNESVADFFKRRFSQEIVDYAVKPFVAGIYSGDAENLLVSETFPVLHSMEKRYGSVLKGFVKNKTSRKKSITFRKGMQMLTDKIASQLTGLRCNAKANAILKESQGYKVYWEEKGNTEEAYAKNIVLALPSKNASDLFRFNSPLPEAIKNIKYSPVTVVHSVYDKENVKSALNGFGALHPIKEGLFTSGTIWSSSLFRDRCPKEKVLLTSFIRQETEDENKSKVLKKVHKELATNLGIIGKPYYQNLKTWKKAIPQYDSNYKKARIEIENAASENIFVVANWYKGVSIPDCIKKASDLAGNL